MLVAICIDLSSTSPRICTTCIKEREESGLSSRHQFTTSHAIKFKYQRNPALEIMAEISRVIFLSPANRLRVHVLIISFSLFLFLLSMHDSISSGARETCKDLIAKGNFFWKLVNLEGGTKCGIWIKMDNGSIVESIFFFEIKIKNDLQSLFNSRRLSRLETNNSRVIRILIKK